MIENIFDGNPHPLTEGYAYIGIRIDYEKSYSEFEKIRTDLIKAWLKYKTKNIDEYLLDILIKHFIFLGDCHKYFQIVMRPPHIFGVLAQTGLICIKFPRDKNDGLE